MPTYRAIAATETDPEAPLTSSLAKAWADNLLASLEADSTAPVNATAWHPFDKVTNGDANTGRIWGFTANGAVAAVTSPDFVDGFDYAFLFQDVNSTGSGVQFRVNLWRETTGAYAGPVQVGPSFGSGQILSGWLELPFCRRVLSAHLAFGMAGTSSVAPTTTQSGILCSPSQKILRAQFTSTTGNITGTASSFIYMYRRRSV